MDEFVITIVSRQDLQNLIDEAVTKSMQRYFREMKSPISEYFDAPDTAAFLGISINRVFTSCHLLNFVFKHIS